MGGHRLGRGAAGWLVGREDGRWDVASAQVGADGAAGVALVRQDSARSPRRSPRTGAAERDTRHDRGELGAVVDVAAGQHHRQRPPVAIARQVDLGGEPAAGPADGMITWFALPAAGSTRPRVGGGPAAGAGGVLMGADDAGVDRDLAVEFVDRFGDHPDLRHQRGEGAGA